MYALLTVTILCHRYPIGTTIDRDIQTIQESMNRSTSATNQQSVSLPPISYHAIDWMYVYSYSLILLLAQLHYYLTIISFHIYTAISINVRPHTTLNYLFAMPLTLSPIFADVWPHRNTSSLTHLHHCIPKPVLVHLYVPLLYSPSMTRWLWWWWIWFMYLLQHPQQMGHFVRTDGGGERTRRRGIEAALVAV